MSEKPLVWMGSSLDDVRAFPAGARRLAGFQLRRVQSGLMPSDWKPMKSIGHGVNEIRIRTKLEHRVCYVARFPEAVYVLHAFEKRSRQTPHADIDLARARLADVQATRRAAKDK